MSRRPAAVVFDLGGVLIDWNPRHLYRDLIPDEAELERFLAEVCTPAWNAMQDNGRTIAEANAEAIGRFPAQRPLIEAYYGEFGRMMRCEIAGTVAILEELHEAGTPLFALSNWSAETFHHAERRFAFIKRFDGLPISGREGMRKPDPAIFRLAAERFGVEASRTVFIDDHAPNIESAGSLGFHALHFTWPDELRRELVALGLLPA